MSFSIVDMSTPKVVSIALYIVVVMALFGLSRALDSRFRTETGLTQTFDVTKPVHQRVFSRTVSNFDLDFIGNEPDLPTQFFDVEWDGVWYLLNDQEIDLYAGADDFVSIHIDGELILVRSTSDGTNRTTSVPLSLKAGPHRVKIRYRQYSGGYALNIGWVPSGSFRAIRRLEPENFFPDFPQLEEVAVNKQLRLFRSMTLVTAVAPPALILAWWLFVAVRKRYSRGSSVGAETDGFYVESEFTGGRSGFVWLSLAIFIVLALLHTWPLVLAPETLSRTDNADTVFHQWTLAWLAHQIVQDPLRLFDANIFYPDHLTLAYSDHLFIPGIFVVPLLWIGFSPILAYNVLLITGFTLTGWAMCLVIQGWTHSRLAGLISGSLVSFNAFTLTRFPQIQDQHLEFLPLALLALDRLLRRPSVRRALSLSGWFVLQALTTGYWLVFTTVAMVAATMARPREWVVRSRLIFVPYVTLAATVAGVALLPFLLPYWFVSQEQGLVRTLKDAAQFSASFNNYLATGGRLHFGIWSEHFYKATGGGDSLFPGAIALVLVVVAIGSGIAIRDSRARMALVFGAVAFALSFGPVLPGYALLYDVFPLMSGIRGVSRFGQLFLVAVAILAGFGWVRVRQILMRISKRTSHLVVLPLGVIVFLGIHAESIRAPINYSTAPVIPEVLDALQDTDDDAVLVFFPFYRPREVFKNAQYLMYSTRHFRPMLNGYSGFAPQSYFNHVAALRDFPKPSSIDYLRDVGVTHVITISHLMSPDIMRALESHPDLKLISSDGDLKIYELRI